MAHSLEEFAEHLLKGAIELEMIKFELLDHAGEIVEHEAKRVLGSYEYGWVELADYTKKDRIAKGFTPNDPLLRTGDLRESIHHKVAAGWMGQSEVFIGTDMWYAKYQELGTYSGLHHIPPRPFLAGSLIRNEAKIAEHFGRTFAAVVSGGINPYWGGVAQHWTPFA